MDRIYNFPTLYKCPLVRVSGCFSSVVWITVPLELVPAASVLGRWQHEGNLGKDVPITSIVPAFQVIWLPSQGLPMPLLF